MFTKWNQEEKGEEQCISDLTQEQHKYIQYKLLLQILSY